MKLHMLVKLLYLLFFSIQVNAENIQDRQFFNKLKPEEQAIVLTWLNNTCTVGEENILENKIIALGDTLDPVFWEAFHLGPTEQDTKKLRNTAISNYIERNVWLQKFGSEQIGKEEAKRQLSISESQYVDRVVNKYINGYKTSALSGLGLVGTVQRGDELNRIANEPKNPAQTAAQEALKLIVERNSTKQLLR